MTTKIEKDAQTIAALGGPAKLARLLGFAPESGTQRVQNWITRGIPVRIKYERPDLFAAKQEKAAA